MNIDTKNIQFAIVSNGSTNIGNCLNRYNYLVYVRDNPDNTQYDSFCSRTSSMWRQEIVSRLPSHNAGSFLSKFRSVGDDVYVADAWIEVDSGD